MKKKVVVGMSGGVDSSVAAYILKEQGYDVIGVTMKLWDSVEERENQCCSLSAVEDARNVANKLNIPFYTMNFKDVFKKKVVDYFIDEYSKGKTPNPCIACNRYVKFEKLLDKAISLGADYVATGHYAIIEKNHKNDRYILKKSNAIEKDQTYALYNLTQEQLSHVLMPLGTMKSKDNVREIAKKLGLAVSNKPDSQDICFVEDGDYVKFIKENSNLKSKKGYFTDKSGNILGEHEGIMNYTIGQRKGLGLALGYPAYVIDIDLANNSVIIGRDSEVYGAELIVEDVNLISLNSITEIMEVKAKIRYSAKEEYATLIPIGNDKLKVKFKNPVRAITNGQSVVFYDGDILIGGGKIAKRRGDKIE